MTLSAEQLFALDVMEIPVWVLRHTGQETEPFVEPAAVSEASHHDLSNSSFLIVCDKFEQQSPEHFLLTAILKSIQIDIQTVTFTDIASIQSQSASLTAKYLLIFSDEKHSLLTRELGLMSANSHSLKQLIQQPQLKSDLWKSIKAWRL
jgi:DNA polymerase III psi subunit